jgi:protein-disulfide isomerase
MRVFLLSFVLLASGSLFSQAAKDSAKSAKTTPAKTAPAAPAVPAFSLPPRASGRPDAPLVIEVFSDFECPACRELYVKTIKRMIPEYCATGKVYLIHHDFPLPQHRYSRLAAVWADAAATIGKYEQVTDALFSNQDSWVTSGKVSEVVATALGPADFQKVKQVVDTHRTEIDAAIEADFKAGSAMEVKETPTTRVTSHGKVITDKQAGQIAYSVLRTYIEQNLGN